MEKFFFEKLLYSKCPFGQIKCSFDSSTEKPNKTTEHICSNFENVCLAIVLVFEKKNMCLKVVVVTLGAVLEKNSKKLTKIELNWLKIMKC